MTSSDGFVIDEIEMKDFMRYLGGTSKLELLSRFTVITGKTGSGKTSILDAVTFALYKRTSRTDISGIGISDICRPGGHVRVRFRQGGNLFEVERGFSQKGSAYLSLHKNGSEIAGSIPELEEIVRETVGLDYDGFRNSTFVRQEEMKELGAESDSQRLRIFQKLFRLEIFEKAQAQTKNEYDEIQRGIEMGEHDVEFLRERLSGIPDVVKDLGDAKEDVRVIRGSLKEISERLLTEQERLTELEKKHEAFISAKTSFEEKERRTSNIRKEIERTEKAGDEANELRETIKRLEEETKDYERLMDEKAKLKETSHLAAGLEKEKKVHTNSFEEAEREFERERLRLKERLNVSEGRIAALSTTVDKDEAFRLLRTEGALEERISRIEMEIEWLAGREEVIDQIQRDKEDALQHLSDVSGKVQDINEDSFILTEIENQVDQVKKDLENLRERQEKRVREIKTAIQSVDSRIEKLGFDDDAKRRLRALEKAVADTGARRERLRDSRRRLDQIGDVGRLLEDLKKRLAQGEKDVKGLKKQLRGFASDEDEYRNTRKSVEELKKSKSEAEKELSGKEVLVESLERRLAELEAEKQAMKEKTEALDNQRSGLETYAILKDQIFHKKGVAMYAINQLLPELEIETSQNLIDLTDGRFTRVNLKTHEAKREYGVKIEVEGVDGDWHDVAEFSGGERTQINAALRFAIAKQLAGLPQVGRTYGRMKTLFIDEGDLGSLDTETNRDLFIHKLFKMGEFFDRVVLITHLGEVADRFPGKIRVQMTSEQESRIEVVS